jgi:hypothetical protein
MKSIYEEALDNTQILLALVDVKQLNAKKKINMLYQIEHALEQAQKQEKLLKLYKELATVRDDEYYDMRKMKTYLKQQIEELEK